MVTARCSAWFADGLRQLCQQYSAAARNVKQELQDKASSLQADFHHRLAEWDCELRKLKSSQFARYPQQGTIAHLSQLVACKFVLVMVPPYSM